MGSRRRAEPATALAEDQMRRDRLVAAVDVLTVLCAMLLVAGVVAVTMVLAANGDT
ncbi:MAG: hypothetical protein OEW53_02235 [Actinomycetota bacterium]|nr:hypothetical protein [Actinomycetota bacterium]